MARNPVRIDKSPQENQTKKIENEECEREEKEGRKRSERKNLSMI